MPLGARGLGSTRCIGNVLNQGHARLEADAITLDSLLKLESTKAADRKTTLMDALVLLIERRGNEELYDVATELTGLTDSKRIELRDIDADLRMARDAVASTLAEADAEEADLRVVATSHVTPLDDSIVSASASVGSGKSTVSASLRAHFATRGGSGALAVAPRIQPAGATMRGASACPIPQGAREQFISEVRCFAADAQAQLDGVAHAVSTAAERAHDLALYFGEDVKSTPPSKVLSVLESFIRGMARSVRGRALAKATELRRANSGSSAQ
ncbi:hypothetical protein EON66_12010 [archaeon]|nr:MAG: hypothetical protein EON66_12010 [archaeon]